MDLVAPGSSLMRDSRDVKISPSSEGEIAVIGVPWDWNVTGPPGSRLAPRAIREKLYGFSRYSPTFKSSLESRLVDLGDIKVAARDWELTRTRITSVARRSYKTYKFSLFLGGDHSITEPLVEALIEEYGEVGILMFDAHYDLRSVDEGSTSGDWLWRLSNKFSGRVKAAIIGIADYANPYYLQERAETLGYFIVDRMSLYSDLREALNAVDKLAEMNMKAYYITIDIDHLDQAYAPGTGAPTPIGMRPEETIEILMYAAKRIKPKAVDIVEVNPLLDVNNATSKLAAKLALLLIHSLQTKSNGEE
ncbi:MAG: arginase family protein [Desulfurococcales archaeon]|nr:arginase family protein [Desulfurococcales archaeon]